MAHYEGSSAGFVQVREVYECRECRSHFMGRAAYLAHRVCEDGTWRCLTTDERYRANLLDSAYSIWGMTPGGPPAGMGG